jgi:hypothetical protein
MMLGMKQRSYLIFSGCTWFFIGAFLLYKGIRFISQSGLNTAYVAMAVGIGFLKGRFVLSKTVKRVQSRLATLQEPIRFKDAYSKSYWILIGAMMCLGMLLKIVPFGIRGVIDVAVGSALIYGAMLYLWYLLPRSISIER